MRESRENAWLIKAYAEENGITLQTARTHRREKKQSWLEYADKKLKDATQVLPPVEELNPVEEAVGDVARVYKLVEAAEQEYNQAKSSNDAAWKATAFKRYNDALQTLREFRRDEPKIRREMGELVAWATVLPAIERMHNVMSESLTEIIVSELRKCIPKATELERQAIASEIKDKLFRLWSAKKLMEEE